MLIGLVTDCVTVVRACRFVGWLAGTVVSVRVRGVMDACSFFGWLAGWFADVSEGGFMLICVLFPCRLLFFTVLCV